MMPVLRLRPSGAWPAIVVAASSGAWGLYWLPLRALNEAGIPAAWVPALLYVGPFALLALTALAGRRSGFTLRSAFTGMLAGSALALYSDSLLFTEVVRALIFFYLTPVWSTILERILLGNRISAVRLASILIGFSGMGIAVGAGFEDFLSGFNVGDAMALASGFAWAWASIRIYSGREGGALVLSTWFLGFGALTGLLLALSGLGEVATGALDVDRVAGLLPYLLAFGVLVVIPSVIAIMWGAKILAPGLVGILMMTEVSVGAISAALWAGEPIGLREVVGIALVTLAGVLEAGFGLVAHRFRRG